MADSVPLPAALDEPAPPPAEPGPPPTLSPVASTARVNELDVVRGLAVFGILFVNMPLYNGPLGAYFGNEQSGWFQGFADQAALWIIRVLAEAKFYTLFSFLFGLGFGVQMARANAKGVQGFGWLYARRLFVLLLIGTLHLVFFWLGDVLHLYAIFGYLLLAFRNRKQKTVMIWAVCLTVMPWVAGTGFMTYRAATQTPAVAEMRARQREVRLEHQRWEMKEQTRVQAEGTRREVFDQRVGMVAERLPGEIFWGIEVWAMFLLGLWVARSGLLEDIPGHLPLLRRLCLIGAVGGVGFSLVLAAWRKAMGANPPELQGFFWFLGFHLVARLLHALFYATGLVLLVQHEQWRRRLAPLAAVGRMALSNYLSHSVICVTLFNSFGFGLFGFGLYGKTGFAAGLALTLAICAFQLVFSPWWLARYRYGPMEWLWRSATYGRLQPMKV